VLPASTVADTDVAYWRARAEVAEARAEVAEARAEESRVRVEELGEQVAVLGRMLFGRSSEKNGGSTPGVDGGSGEAPDGKPGKAPDGGRSGRRGASGVSGRGVKVMGGGITRIWTPGRRSMTCPRLSGSALAAGRRSSRWGPTTASSSSGG
jgi:hypothetical protein